LQRTLLRSLSETKDCNISIIIIIIISSSSSSNNNNNDDDSRISSATAEIARVCGRQAVQGLSRSLMLVPIESLQHATSS